MARQMLNLNPQVRSPFGPRRWQLGLVRSRQALFSAFFLVIVVAVVWGYFGTSTPPQSLQIAGYAGHLGEWELTANLSRDVSRSTRDFSGPLGMKHVGMCSSDGPEGKTGEMRLSLSRWASNIEARLLIEGVECTYSGNISGADIGTMVCPDRRAVPLTLWAN